MLIESTWLVAQCSGSHAGTPLLRGCEPPAERLPIDRRSSLLPAAPNDGSSLLSTCAPGSRHEERFEPPNMTSDAMPIPRVEYDPVANAAYIYLTHDIPPGGVAKDGSRRSDCDWWHGQPRPRFHAPLHRDRSPRCQRQTGSRSAATRVIRQSTHDSRLDPALCPVHVPQCLPNVPDQASQPSGGPLGWESRPSLADRVHHGL